LLNLVYLSLERGSSNSGSKDKKCEDGAHGCGGRIARGRLR
jgi:hypothetical protein